jgi:bifunctional DNA-binding transcriptional regulator/antitoxin component of YhaV-PrlF toxin-antitoxin module
MKVTPDSTHRIVLTKEIRNALNLKPGQPLEVSISAGAVFLSPVVAGNGKIVRKGKLKVYSGKIPDMDVEEAVSKARHYTRL